MYKRHRNPFSTSGSGLDPANTTYPSSLTFSTWCWMGDYAQIGVQTYNNSATTLYGSNRNGWTVSLSTVNDASVITVLSAAGMYRIEAGFDWVQFQRSSSTNTIFYVGQSRR